MSRDPTTVCRLAILAKRGSFPSTGESTSDIRGDSMLRSTPENAPDGRGNFPVDAVEG